MIIAVIIYSFINIFLIVTHSYLHVNTEMAFNLTARQLSTVTRIIYNMAN